MIIEFEIKPVLMRLAPNELIRMGNVLRARVAVLFDEAVKPGKSPEERITIAQRALMLNQRNNSVNVAILDGKLRR